MLNCLNSRESCKKKWMALNFSSGHPNPRLITFFHFTIVCIPVLLPY